MDAFLIEDSPVIRQRLIPMLSAMAHVRVVGMADSESEAWHWLERNVVDVVLLDLALRQGSGFGLLQRLQATGAAARIRVVLTNHATDDMRARCQRLGATAFFDKSRELEALFAYLRIQGASPADVF
ncbi:MAG TPA: response regulator [Burkholderiaceae bacterium]|nr:response regulator [Burkholderiaceae bacterium]